MPSRKWDSPTGAFPTQISELITIGSELTPIKVAAFAKVTAATRSKNISRLTAPGTQPEEEGWAETEEDDDEHGTYED